MPLYCPVDEVKDDLPFDYEELAPVLNHLHSGKGTKDLLQFPKGTLTPEGKLDCCKQDLGAAGAKMLCDVLADNSFVKGILFGTGGIGDEGAKAVAGLLGKNGNIKTVYLGCNLIGKEGAKELADGLKNNETVNALWLKRNPLGLEGAKEIVRLLEKNPRIETLDLTNTVGAQGASYIISALKKLRYPVKHLYLEGNQIQGNEGENIGGMLSALPRLETLCLGVNPIGNEGLKQIWLSAKGHPLSLKRLSLRSCGLGDSNNTGFLIARIPELGKLHMLDLGYARSTKVLKGKGNDLSQVGEVFLSSLINSPEAPRIIDLTRTNLEPWQYELLEKAKENPRILSIRTSKHPKYNKQKLMGILKRNRSTEEAKSFLDREGNLPHALAIRSVYR